MSPRFVPQRDAIVGGIVLELFLDSLPTFAGALSLIVIESLPVAGSASACRAMHLSPRVILIPVGRSGWQVPVVYIYAFRASWKRNHFTVCWCTCVCGRVSFRVRGANGKLDLQNFPDGLSASTLQENRHFSIHLRRFRKARWQWQGQLVLPQVSSIEKHTGMSLAEQGVMQNSSGASVSGLKPIPQWPFAPVWLWWFTNDGDDDDDDGVRIKDVQLRPLSIICSGRISRLVWHFPPVG